MSFWTFLLRNKKQVATPKLTQEEIELSKIIQFDEELILEIKKSTGNVIYLIPEVDEYGETLQTKDEGLCSLAEYRPNHNFVQSQKDRFGAYGYLLFLFQDSKKLHYLAMIKSQNELDIIRWRQTSAGNYNLKNEDIIAKLTKWKTLFDFSIIDVGEDYFDLKPISLPSNVDKMSDEMYEFCPDIVDQGFEDIIALKNELQQKNILQFWWD